MPYKITIPEPCIQSWDSMIANAEGRFCNSCAKTVINFAGMGDEEVQNYFNQHPQQSICGRFKNIQLHRIVINLPENIFSSNMPAWMKFLVACLLIFGISIFPFESTVVGKTPTAISFYKADTTTVKQEKKPGYLKNKIRRIKKRHHKKQLALVEMMVMGNVWSTPYPPLSMKSIFDLAGNAGIGFSIIRISSENTSSPEKKQPAPTPYLPTAFILPTILFSRKKINTTMD